MTAPLRTVSSVFTLVALALALPACSGLLGGGGRRAPAAPPRPLAASLTYPDLVAPPPLAMRRVELPNGMVVFLAEDRRLPLVRARARVAAGSLLDPPDHVGLAAIGAATMRSGGAGAQSADALNRALESVGAAVEAGASDEATTVTMRTLTESLDAVLPLFVDVLTRPRFEAGPVALAKTQQRSAIARRNDTPGSIAGRALDQALYGADSPFARTPDVWTVDAVSREDLAAWHARTVVPTQTSLAVWGDFDADAMAARLEAAFAGWTTPAGWTAEPLPELRETGRSGVVFVDRPDLNQTTILLGHAGRVRADHPDVPALVVMNEILGGGFSGRLLQTVRTRLGLAYSVYGDYGADLARPGLFAAGTSTRADATVQATEAVLGVIRDLRTAPPTDAEMALALESYRNRSVFDADTPGALLAQQQTLDAYGYPLDFDATLRERVLAVTAADVQRVASEYLTPDRVTIVVVGNGAAFDRPLTVLGPVDTLDVTVPRVPPAGAAVAGDPDGGRAALDALAERLGGAAVFDALRTFRATSETRATVGGAETVIGSTLTVRFPEGAEPEALRLEQQLADGASVTVVVQGDDARVVTPRGTQAAPASVAAEVRGQSFLSLPVLLARRGELRAERMPAAEGTVVVFRLPGDRTPYTLTLGADGMPQSIHFEPPAGGGARVVIAMDDLRETGGLRLPFRYVQTVGGEAAGTRTVREIELDPALDAATFATGAAGAR